MYDIQWFSSLAVQLPSPERTNHVPMKIFIVQFVRVHGTLHQLSSLHALLYLIGEIVESLETKSSVLCFCVIFQVRYTRAAKMPIMHVCAGYQETW